jgi:flavin-dependent dehydrogenase
VNRGAYDLATIGAGPAGSALALRAARGGASVLLVDRDRLAGPRFGETAPPVFRRAVAELGLGRLLDRPEIAREAPSVVSVWGQDAPMERSHIASPFSSAVHLDRRQFDIALTREARGAGATVRLGARIRVMAGPSDDHQLELSTGEVGRARFLVLAVGRSAGVGRFRQRRHYLNDHVCLVRYLAGEPRESRTLIEAIAEGWIYAAALPGQRMVVALTTSARSVATSPQARLASWDEAISRSVLVAPALAGLTPIGPPRIVNSRASAASRVGGKTWCVMGDARIAPDPLSGQGLLWALDDAAFVAHSFLNTRSDTIAAGLKSRSQTNLADHCNAAALFYGAERRFAGKPFWRTAAGHRTGVAS